MLVVFLFRLFVVASDEDPYARRWIAVDSTATTDRERRGRRRLKSMIFHPTAFPRPLLPTYSLRLYFFDDDDSNNQWHYGPISTVCCISLPGSTAEIAMGDRFTTADLTPIGDGFVRMFEVFGQPVAEACSYETPLLIEDLQLQQQQRRRRRQKFSHRYQSGNAAEQQIATDVCYLTAVEENTHIYGHVRAHTTREIFPHRYISAPGRRSIQKFQLSNKCGLAQPLAGA